MQRRAVNARLLNWNWQQTEKFVINSGKGFVPLNDDVATPTPTPRWLQQLAIQIKKLSYKILDLKLKLFLTFTTRI